MNHVERILLGFVAMGVLVCLVWLRELDQSQREDVLAIKNTRQLLYERTADPVTHQDFGQSIGRHIYLQRQN